MENTNVSVPSPSINEKDSTAAMTVKPPSPPATPTISPIDHSEQQKLNVIGEFSSLLGYYIIGSATGTKDAISHYNSHRASTDTGAGVGPLAVNNSTTKPQSQSPLQSKSPIPRSAASIIAERKTNGTYGPSGQGQQAHSLSPSTQFIANSMGRHLYRDDKDAVGIGGAIISVPALDLQSLPGMMPPSGGQQQNQRNVNGENNSGSSDIISGNRSSNSNASNILPSIGESANRNMNENGNGRKRSSDNGIDSGNNIPVMVASVLGHCNNDPPSGDALQLEEASSKATGIEYAAASNLGRPISYTRSSAPHAPGAMARTLNDSFSSLVDSRLRAWTLLLLRHSLSSGDEDSRARLMSLLASNKIDFSAIVTTFRVDTTSTAVISGKKKNGTDGTSEKVNEGGNGKYSRENCDYVLPLTLDVHIDLKLQDKVISLQLKAPGTVAASFHDNTDLLTYFQCQIDANSLVSDMISQARLVVLKAVAKATTCNVNHLYNRTETEQTLSQFGSSLNLSSVGGTNGSGVDSMATSSVREESSDKLPSNYNSGNGALQRNFNLCKNKNPTPVSKESANNLASNKRTRSVTWDNSVNDLTRVQSALKKPKRLNSSKRSIVSFGKPNSAFFRSAKNATFAEFGNLTKNPNVARVCPTSGRMESVPKPHQSTTNLSLGARHSLSMGRNLNASFTSSSRTPTPNATREQFLPQSSPSSTGTPNLLSSFGLLRKPTFTELARNAKYSQDGPRKPENSLLSFTNKGLSFTAHNNLKRTPTQLEDLLIRRTHGSNPNGNIGSGSGNANWG